MEPVTARAAASTSFERFFHDAWPGAHRLASLLAQDVHLGDEIAQEAFARHHPSRRLTAPPAPSAPPPIAVIVSRSPGRARS